MECIGCGADVPDEDGPVHRYLVASPGCWRLYGEVLVREYTDAQYYSAHCLSVDAYAVQHPGTESPQTIQSEAVHLARLCLLIERGLAIEAANAAMARFAKNSKGKAHWLVPPSHKGAITVVDIWNAVDAPAHRDAAWTWATCAWQAWGEHHDQVRAWLDRYLWREDKA